MFRIGESACLDQPLGPLGEFERDRLAPVATPVIFDCFKFRILWTRDLVSPCVRESDGSRTYFLGKEVAHGRYELLKVGVKSVFLFQLLDLVHALSTTCLQSSHVFLMQF